MQGLPVGKGWPTEQQLLGLLAVKPHDTITLADMEDERETLCSTGLFRNVRLKISPPGDSLSPHSQCASPPPLLGPLCSRPHTPQKVLGSRFSSLRRPIGRPQLRPRGAAKR